MTQSFANQTIFLGNDHAAYSAKIHLLECLQNKGYAVQDLGSHSLERTDYPQWAKEVVAKVQSGKGIGILMCGSGIGVSIVANRFAGIRAALCRSACEAELSRQHNDANILCLGARVNSDDEVWNITEAWLKSDFEAGRHYDRITLFNDLGETL